MNKHDPDDWSPFIIRAHDDFIPLRDIIDKFGLTHIQHQETGDMVTLEEFDIDCIDTPHTVGFLRKAPLGEEWAAYIVSHIEEVNGTQKVMHKIMAKMRLSKG